MCGHDEAPAGHRNTLCYLTAGAPQYPALLFLLLFLGPFRTLCLELLLQHPGKTKEDSLVLEHLDEVVSNMWITRTHRTRALSASLSCIISTPVHESRSSV